jgi:hypothetical protein
MVTKTIRKVKEKLKGDERYQVAIAMIRRTNEKPNGDGNGPKIEGEEVETIRNNATSKKIGKGIEFGEVDGNRSDLENHRAMTRIRIIRS